MKNNTFSISRFGKYFVHDLKTQVKNIGMLWLVCVLMPVIFYATYMLFGNIFSPSGHLYFIKDIGSGPKGIDGPILGVRFAVFVVTTMVLTMVFPSRAYGDITKKSEGSAWLMLPASRLEKYISMMVICLAVVPLTFIAGHLLCDWLVCLADPTCGKAMAAFNINSAIGQPDAPQFVANGFWLLYAMIIEYALTFLLGALIFKKWKVIFTIIALFVLSNILTPILAACISGMDWNEIGRKIENWCVDHADRLDFYFNACINVGLAFWIAVCGTWSWFRLKNRQH